MKILHIAPINTAGVPLALVRAENAIGIQSRLITFHRHPRDFGEDICLDLPLFDFWGVHLAKKLFSPSERVAVRYDAKLPETIPPTWIPGRIEHTLIRMRERLWQPRIERAIADYDIVSFDVIQLDGGMGFYRDGRIIRQLKSGGKKIICCYTGSDLRVRGVIPEIDHISDLNVSVEFDHQFLHTNLKHVPFPIEPDQYGRAGAQNGETVLISHAPTNRQAKGSHIIIPIVRELEKEYPVKLVLIENLPYHKALELKRQTQIFIDQIGNLGYGISSLEALSMGIACCSCLAPGFENAYPEHPFIVIDEQNLKEKLIPLIENATLRQEKARQGIQWVRSVHDAKKVVQRIHQFAGIGERHFS
ncbi:hypothetical protein JXJ21_10460 [candidate division KSB1 bacterium]|nr:hypothetical protein [candidate division KSB1 bacterium]